jgi:hypothetical protein
MKEKLPDAVASVSAINGGQLTAHCALHVDLSVPSRSNT